MLLYLKNSNFFGSDSLYYTSIIKAMFYGFKDTMIFGIVELLNSVFL